MNRYAPRTAKAYAPNRLYCVRKEQGSSGSTLAVEILTRELLWLVGRDGNVVRYDRGRQQLHPESEFKAFLKEQKSRVGFIRMAGQGRSYNSVKDHSLPFIVDWEKAVAPY